MPASHTRPVTVRKVGPQGPIQASLRRTPRMAAKYFYFLGTVSAVLGTAYLSGSLGLSLIQRSHSERTDTLLKSPQEFMIYITPRKKEVAPESPSASAVVPAPDSLTVAAAPPPATPPEILKEEPKPKPPPAPVVSAQKSTFAHKTTTRRQQRPPTGRPDPPQTQPVAKRTKESASPPKDAAPSGTIAAGRLDELPHLLNSPSVAFPASVRHKGITQGRAVLEVEIDIRGRVTVKRILEISDSALESTARNFAAAARFSTPRRGGQPVRTLFRWPLTLRP